MRLAELRQLDEISESLVRDYAFNLTYHYSMCRTLGVSHSDYAAMPHRSYQRLLLFARYMRDEQEQYRTQERETRYPNLSEVFSSSEYPATPVDIIPESHSEPPKSIQF